MAYNPYIEDAFRNADLAGKALDALQKIYEEDGGKGSPSEEGHSGADCILVEFVEALGYKQIAAAYDKIGKWYA